MALPIVKINNLTGSDTAASGAGPGDGTTTGATLTGVDASTDATGLIVTLPNADLTNVATDGSHALWLKTAAGRQFSRITAKANSGTASANVTVATAYTASLTAQTYAIGGKRATLDNADTKVLFSTDLEANWEVRIENTGTDYTVTSNIIFNSTGTSASPSNDVIIRGTGGRVVIKGTNVAVTRIIETQANMKYVRFVDIIFDGTNTATTAVSAIADGTTGVRFVRCDFKSFTSHGVVARGTHVFHRCRFYNNTGAGYGTQAASRGASSFYFCSFDNNTGGGLSVQNSQSLIFCRIFKNTADGYKMTATNSGTLLLGVTIYQNSGDGIELTSGSVIGTALIGVSCVNNSGYGLNILTSGPVTQFQQVTGFHSYNNSLGHTSDAGGLAGLMSHGEENYTATGDPLFTDALAGDFRPLLDSPLIGLLPTYSATSGGQHVGERPPSFPTDAEIAQAVWTYANRTTT